MTGAEDAAAKGWLQRIRRLALSGPVKIMNVCGGHERSIAQAGLRSLLPEGVELIPGPGCPVCVCPEEDVYAAIRIALDHDVVLATFGDMLRVPANVGKGEIRSLEQAKAAGADVRPIASPLEAVAIADAEPGRTVVFFAAGFETTMAPVAAMVSERLPKNLLLLLSGRRTWPAVAMLLASGPPGFDALIAPGHVSTVMGPEEWDFVVEGDPDRRVDVLLGADADRTARPRDQLDTLGEERAQAGVGDGALMPAADVHDLDRSRQRQPADPLQPAP